MKEIITDIVGYANNGTASLLLKPSMNTLSPTQSILVAEKLLSWIYGQAALRKSYPSKKDFRPMCLSIPQPWHDDLRKFISGNSAVSELFEATPDTLKFQTDVSALEKIEVEEYVFANFDRRKLLMK